MHPQFKGVRVGRAELRHRGRGNGSTGCTYLCRRRVKRERNWKDTSLHSRRKINIDPGVSPVAKKTIPRIYKQYPRPHCQSIERQNSTLFATVRTQNTSTCELVAIEVRIYIDTLWAGADEARCARMLEARRSQARKKKNLALCKRSGTMKKGTGVRIRDRCDEPAKMSIRACPCVRCKATCSITSSPLNGSPAKKELQLDISLLRRQYLENTRCYEQVSRQRGRWRPLIRRDLG